jgi:hypothetical protein
VLKIFLSEEGEAMIRITSIHPQRRGFRHHFRVVMADHKATRAAGEVSVYVNEEELYNYHRFQIASLTQLGRLCRFALEDEAGTPHQLQMLWNRELAGAAWTGVGLESASAASDLDMLQVRAATADHLRVAGPPEDEE